MIYFFRPPKFIQKTCSIFFDINLTFRIIAIIGYIDLVFEPALISHHS